MQAKAWYFSRKTWKTQNGLGKLKLVFFHTNYHELTMNGWRGILFLRVIVLRIENPYNILRQIANLPQQVRKART